MRCDYFGSTKHESIPPLIQNGNWRRSKQSDRIGRYQSFLVFPILRRSNQHLDQSYPLLDHYSNHIIQCFLRFISSLSYRQIQTLLINYLLPPLYSLCYLICLCIIYAKQVFDLVLKI
jgi:hypothetical protein